MIGKILCRIGLHRMWTWDDALIPDTHCARCGKRDMKIWNAFLGSPKKDDRK